VRVSSNNRGIKDVLYSVADLNVSGILWTWEYICLSNVTS
jgi:hypothetical protein